MLPLVSDYYYGCDNRNRNLNNLKERIKERQMKQNIEISFEKLCSFEKGTMNYETFRKSSTSCKLVKDDKNPLIKYRIEELSEEPKVQLVHKFISKGEIHELLKKMSEYEFDIAPVISEDEELEEQLSDRAAISHYIDEEEDNVANLAKRIKKR